MRRARTWTATLGILTALALGVSAGAWGQEPVSANLDPSGVIHIMRGDVELGMIELNAHGPGWQHAPQKSATVRVSDLPQGAGKQFIGSLPVPNTGGGAVTFTQTVKTTAGGLSLAYDVGMSRDMELNGLQVSVLLAVEQYAGKEVAISHPERELEIVTLPEKQEGEGFQVWYGEGAKIEVARGTPEAITLELLAPADLVIQDLRRWEHPVFEIRFFAIMEEPPREVTAEDKLHLDLKVSFGTAEVPAEL